MASYNTNEFRGGLKIILDSDPYTIVENEFVKPGKGQAFNRVKVRNLKTGRVVDKTFKSGESVEAADVTRPVQLRRATSLPTRVSGSARPRGGSIRASTFPASPS